jgi:CheY-like chemotaxis protein
MGPATITSVSSVKSHRLLLVEDEPALQRIIGGVLSDAGHHVDVVGDVEQALARLQVGDVDLVVTDKNLPGRDGLALLAAVRAGERDGSLRGGVAVVLATGYPSRDSAMRALAHDVDGYLVKPFVSLTRAAEQILAVLELGSTARQAGPRARRVADALAGLPVGLGDVNVAVVAGARTTAVERGLRGARARLVPAVSAERADVVVVADLADVRAISARRRGAAFVLLDPGASFRAIVELIDCGGGALLDPTLLTGDG